MTAGAPALTALLDELDRLRAAATPGPWRPHGEHLIVDCRGVSLIAAKVADADAALIVAEHDAAPKLTAAVRAALALADELEATGDGYLPPGVVIARRAIGDRLRSALTAALEKP